MVLWGQSNGPHTICARAQGILECFANNVVTIVDCNLNSNRHECVQWEQRGLAEIECRCHSKCK